MRFGALVTYFEDLEKVTSGNAIRAILADLFKKTKSKEIDKVVYLTLGRIAPEYSSLVIGMADKMVLKSISLAANKDLKLINQLYKKSGDIGTVAFSTINNTGSLSVEQVYDELNNIAKASGSGSQSIKIRRLAGLFAKSSKEEAKYIARIVIGTLRLGVATMSVLDALSIAFTGDKTNKDKLENAYNLCTDSGKIAKVFAEKGLKSINKIGITVGSPIKMMLAQRVKTLEELKNKIPGMIAAEEKYDGERLQIHYDGINVRIFSRRLDDITNQFPDVIRYIKNNLKAKSYVVEGEAVACKKGMLQPFQLLMRRRRKYDVEKFAAKIPVCVFLFDLLYLNGKTYINRPYPERRKALEKVVKESSNLKLALQTQTDSLSEVSAFFNRSLKRNCEGIIAKSMSDDSAYTAGTRGWNWIKWKKDYVKGLIDTIDIVVVGAFFGKGRRKGTYGALLCAIYNPKTKKYETITKLGTGFTDNDLKEIPKLLKKHEVKEKPIDVSSKLNPDVWFRPEQVAEIIGAEITRSPLHTAGQGYALRFPRFLRWRDDKSPKQTTSLDEIKKLIK